ncbi:MAG: threonine/serine exporter ThrE family protein [Anaerorhabdus sp.]|uniref:threonine/serine ThrE exporter family protein n=1 Tax=Anaerorhabdus sp. TaxID=1872524 RepID=UPI003A881D75
MNPNKVIQLAMKTGSLLLESGAETYRVEDTIVRICSTYGMTDTSCFCTQTGIMMSSIFDGTTYSQVARIQSRSTNLDRIGNLNQLSRDACSIELPEYEKRLNDIISTKTYSVFMNILFASICTFGFTLLYRGKLGDAFVGLILGGIVRYCTLYLESKGLNSFFNTSGCAFLITLTALLLENYHLIASRNTVIIGTIMLLVPGLAITNAIRDSIAGDLVSGTARAVEALLIAVAVALGSGIALTIWLSLGGII